MPGLTTGPVGVGGGKTDDVIEDEATEELETEVNEPPETELDKAVKVPEIDELGVSVILLDIEDVWVEELIEEELMQGTALQSGL